MKVSVKANHTSVASFSVENLTFVDTSRFIIANDLLNRDSVDGTSWDEHPRVGE